MKQRKYEQKTTISFEKTRRKKQQKTKKRSKKDDFIWKKTTKKWSFIYLKNDLNDGNQWKRRKRQ